MSTGSSTLTLSPPVVYFAIAICFTLTTWLSGQGSFSNIFSIPITFVTSQQTGDRASNRALIQAAVTSAAPHDPVTQGSKGDSAGKVLSPEPAFSLLFGQLPEPYQQQLQRLVACTPQSTAEGGRLPAGVISEAMAIHAAVSEGVLVEHLMTLHSLLKQHLGRKQPADAAAFSHSRLRRVVLGALVWQRLHAGAAAGWSLRAQSLVGDICGTLLALHAENAKRKAAIEFLHISKSGGTSLCAAAQQNGCRTQTAVQGGMWGNCKIQDFNDLPRWVSGAGHASIGPLPEGERPWWLRHGLRRSAQENDCAIRSQLMRASNRTFYSNEYAVHRNAGSALAVCGDFLNIAMLRDVSKRLSSHVRSIIVLYRRGWPGTKPAVAWVQGRNASDWRRLAPAAVDNLYVRTLLGEDVFHLPSGAVTVEHAAVARETLLNQYDVLLVLEQEPINKLAMEVGLGWLRSKMPRRNSYHNPPKDLMALMPADFDDLVAANALDGDLYVWGALLQRLDAFVFAVGAVPSVSASALAPPGQHGSAEPRAAASDGRKPEVIKSSKFLGAVAHQIRAAVKPAGGLSCGVIERQ